MVNRQYRLSDYIELFMCMALFVAIVSIFSNNHIKTNKEQDYNRYVSDVKSLVENYRLSLMSNDTNSLFEINLKLHEMLITSPLRRYIV